MHANVRPPAAQWSVSALLIVSAMAGVGMLGLPRALAHSGWLGLPLLLTCGLFAYITSGRYLRVLLSGLNVESVEIIDYSTLGYEAFGVPGRVATHFTQNVTLVGSSIIYIVVIGHMLHMLLDAVPQQVFSSIAGLLLGLFVCFVPSLEHVRWNAWFAVGTTVLTALLILSMLFISPVAEPELVLLDQGGLAYTFAVFTFAYGGHSVHPSIFATTRSTVGWARATIAAFFTTVFFLYLPVATISYRVLGANLVLADSVLEALAVVVPSNFSFLFIIAVLSMTVHVTLALPVLFIPTLQRIEATVIGNHCKPAKYVDVGNLESAQLEPPANCCTAHRSVRIAVTLAVTLLAVLLPYITELMAIVACVSMACDVYIFPSLFMLHRSGGSMSRPAKALAWLIALFGMIGAVAGLGRAIPALVAKIAEDSVPTTTNTTNTTASSS